MELGEVQRPDNKQPSAVKPTISFSHFFPPIIMISVCFYLGSIKLSVTIGIGALSAVWLIVHIVHTLCLVLTTEAGPGF